MANLTFNKLCLFLVTSFITTFAAVADATRIIEMRESDRLEFQAMKEGEVFYRYTMKPFTDAFSKGPLNLYPGYKEPVADPDKVDIPNMAEQQPIKLTMFVAVASTVVNRPAASIDLAQFARLDRLRVIDPSVESVPLPEREARKTVRLNQPWCTGARACLRSTFAIDNETRLALSVRYGRFARAIFADSEIRMADGAQLASEGNALRELTGINEPIVSQLIQNSFNFGGVIFLTGIHFEIPVVRYAKMMAIAQPMPGDANRSVLTGIYVFAIESHVIDLMNPYIRRLGFPIREAILSTWSQSEDRIGIARGFPDYTQAISLKIASELIK